MEQDLAGFGNKRGKMMGSGWVWAAMMIIIIWILLRVRAMVLVCVGMEMCLKGANIKFFL